MASGIGPSLHKAAQDNVELQPAPNQLLKREPTREEVNVWSLDTSVRLALATFAAVCGIMIRRALVRSRRSLPLDPLDLAVRSPLKHMALLNVAGDPFGPAEEQMAACKRFYAEPEVFVLDVRSREEVAETGTLSKAVNIPHLELETEEALAQLPSSKDTPVLVFCKSGYRSGIAEQILVQQDFIEVLNGGGYEQLKFLDYVDMYNDPRTVVIDVRTPAEVAEGTLKKAINIEYQELPNMADQLPTDKGTPIFVYCKAGSRSEVARRILVDMDYTGVVNGGAYLALRPLDF